MRIRIAYYGQARLLAEKDEEFLEVTPNISAGDVILHLAEKYGDKMSWLLLTERGTPRRSVILAVNDETVDPGSPDVLSEGDVLAVLPAVSGG
jgi:molybdopterin converting factor small subunit